MMPILSPSAPGDIDRDATAKVRGVGKEAVHELKDSRNCTHYVFL